MFSNEIKVQLNCSHMDFCLCVYVLCACHMIQYPIHKDTNRVNKTDITNRMNATCFSVRVNRDSVASTATGSSCSPSSS